MKGKKFAISFLAVVLCMNIFTGCSSSKSASADGSGEAAKEDYTIEVYYLASSGTSLKTEEYEAEGNYDAETTAANVRDELDKVPNPKDEESLLSDYVSIIGLSIDENSVLTVDFSRNYKSMDSCREVLARAGIVKTFVQIDGIDGVKFTIEGEPLLSDDGSEIGLMNENSFVDNSSQNVNSYEKDNVHLFFANETGDALVQEDRTIYHSSNQSLEWAVVDRLIGGPMVAGNTATIPSGTEIISVSTNNGVCYVNLGGGFMNNTLAASGKITVYSIVDSLIESCKADQVQISVEGDMKVTYKDSVELGTAFTEDLSLVATPAAEEISQDTSVVSE